MKGYLNVDSYLELVSKIFMYCLYISINLNV